MKADSKAYLSKTLFLKGVQCPKALYLNKYHPELKDEISDEKVNLFKSGTEVGLLAQQLFPGGIEIPYEGLSHQEQLEETQKAIGDGVQVLYEATFSFDSVFVKNDLLRQGKKGWELYEVKGGTSISEVYLNDLALQYYVVTGAGLPINKAFLVYINNNYVRNGAIEPEKLFNVEEVTKKVLEKQSWIKEEIDRLRRMLSKKEPQISIGPQCENPYGCDFIGHCWKDIPEDSVFDLRGRGTDRFSLYSKGYIDLCQVPLELVSQGQSFQIEAHLNQSEIIDSQPIREFLDTLWYPLYFLDFETIQFAIPQYSGTRPYQQIPFQYSLHYLENEGGDLKQYEFFGDPHTDFREGLIKKLSQQIPANACILAYNASFEKTCLQNMADWFPKYDKKLNKLIDNLRDLAIPFRNKSVYHWKMKGSYSLKNVLPCLVDDLSYKTLEIRDGGMAMDGFRSLLETLDIEQRTSIRQALLDYCRLDTLAMVKILDKLKDLSKARG
jgi:hypothetical protein